MANLGFPPAVFLAVFFAAESVEGGPDRPQTAYPVRADIGDFAPLEAGYSWKYRGHYSSGYVGTHYQHKFARAISVDSVYNTGDTINYRITFRDSAHQRYDLIDSVFLDDTVLSTRVLIRELADGSLIAPNYSDFGWTHNLNPAKYFHRHFVQESEITGIFQDGNIKRWTFKGVISQSTYGQNIGLLFSSVFNGNRSFWATYDTLVQFNGNSINRISVTGLDDRARREPKGRKGTGFRLNPGNLGELLGRRIRP